MLAGLRVQMTQRAMEENLLLERETEGKVLSFYFFDYAGHTMNFYVRHPWRNFGEDCDAMRIKMERLEARHKGPYRGEIIPMHN